MSEGNRLENLYHKGQELVWDGHDLLNSLLDKHGTPNIPVEKAAALHRIFSVIYWGELAAWNISSALVLKLEDTDARLAATSQAHDEARHFYVMERYLETIGSRPSSIDSYSKRFLDSVLKADNAAKMLLGMQLMVEPLALALFKLIRESNIEPVLSELLLMYERDEARHVALGTLYLPRVLKKMSVVQKTDLLAWQFKEYMRQFSMLKARSGDFLSLGISPKTVFDLARKKQIKAMEIMSEEMGRQYPLMGAMIRVIDFRGELEFSDDVDNTNVEKVKSALIALTK